MYIDKLQMSRHKVKGYVSRFRRSPNLGAKPLTLSGARGYIPGMAGEVEYGFVRRTGDVLFSARPEHIDRILEMHNVAFSKNLAPCIMASELRPRARMYDHFAAVALSCQARVEGTRRVIQEAACGMLRSSRFWRDHPLFDKGIADDTMVSCGTVSRRGVMVKGDANRILMIDKELQRIIEDTIRCLPAEVPELPDARAT
jgi:hypothetical protein